jgi:hypothetical protein
MKRVRIKKALFYALFSGLLLCPSVSAMTVAGVKVPEQTTIGEQGQVLVLNGAGIRKKLFIKIYVCALYLAKQQGDMDQILKSRGPKRVTMHFLYHEVSSEKLVNAWEKGFSSNLPEEKMEALRARLAQFNSLFRTMHRGDVIRIDYLPQKGTEVWINDALQGRIEGADFYRALLLVWLGDHPADGELKTQLLGGRK